MKAEARQGAPGDGGGPGSGARWCARMGCREEMARPVGVALEMAPTMMRWWMRCDGG